MTAQALLTVQGLAAGYGSSQVLFGLDFSLRAGEVLTLLGRNGMGKSTTVKCLSGLLAPSAGRIVLDGQDMAGQPAHKLGQAGIGLVPEGRQVFTNLTVRENLVATAAQRNAGKSPWTVERVYALFPRLAERHNQLAGKMSGGEQQMVAIGRALMTNPKLLLLDEATEGLAPLIRLEIWRCLTQLRTEGMAMIVIDKNLRPLLPLADRHCIIEKGRIAWTGDSAALQADRAVIDKYLSV